MEGVPLPYEQDQFTEIRKVGCCFEPLDPNKESIREVEGRKMSGLSGTKSDDFINAAKARGEAAMADHHPRLTKLEKAFRHAALRRKAQDARRAAGPRR